MNDLIPSNHKFCCMALPTGMRYPPDPPFSDGDLTISLNSPVKLSDYWKEQLGAIQSRRWREAELFLTAMTPADDLKTFTSTEFTLDEQVKYLLYSLQMYGYRGRTGKALIVTGGHTAKELAVNAVGTIDIVNPGYSIRQFAMGEFEAAMKAAKQLMSVCSSDEFVRFKKGFWAWVAGIQACKPEDRLHQFTRSVEALFKPKKGETTSKFAHRCQPFIGAGDHQYKVAREIFSLRSAAEHLNSFSGVWKNRSKEKRRCLACLRGFQIETIAGKVYAKILTTGLLDRFRDDDKIDKFWELKDGERVKIWGPPIDLAEEKRQYFRYRRPD